MARLRQNFQMMSGDTKYLKVTVDLPNEADTLNGAVVKWQLFDRDTKEALVEKLYDPLGVQDGIEVEDDSNMFTVKLDPDDTADLDGGFLHEAEITDAAGNVSTIFRGVVVIMEDFIQ